MNIVLVTGANGFIGTHLVAAFKAAGWQVHGVSRRGHYAEAIDHGWPTLEQAALQLKDHPVDVVVHLAGLAHSGAQGAGAAELIEVNAKQTENLFCRSVAAGVKHFVYLSSIKVLGDRSDVPLQIDAPYQPGDDYASSKVAAERALLEASLNSTQLSIVRPPLVYGPGVQANFFNLLQAADSVWPLPLKHAQAPRAWLGIKNLCDFLLTLAVHEASSNPKIWHVADVEQSSVADMLIALRTAMGRSARLLPMPTAVLMGLAKFFGQAGAAQRLLWPLPIDTSVSQEDLSWRPPFSQQQQLAEVVSWYRTR